MRIQVQTPEMNRRRGAFTLMEVMVVVAILVVLAGVASIFVFRYLDDAKIGAAKTSAQAIEKACTAYNLKYGSFPENLQQLITPPDGGRPYIESILDPWGAQFQYDPSANNGNKVEVFTTEPSTGNRISNLQVGTAGQQQQQQR